MINVLRDAQESLVSPWSTKILKQQHCKNGLKMSTDLNIEMVTEFLEQKLQNKPVEKLLSESTFFTYSILEDQVAVAASTVKSSQWGVKHGHMALIADEKKY